MNILLRIDVNNYFINNLFAFIYWLIEYRFTFKDVQKNQFLS